jgi:predicted oxidoreductase (fatty acid repression mutant protein)
VLLHGQHDSLWDIAIEAFEGLVKTGKLSQEIWEKQTLPKLLGFKGAYGTVRTFAVPFEFGFISWKLEVSGPVHS